jgi:hypothetical protein
LCTYFQRFLTNHRKVLEYAEYFAKWKRWGARQYSIRGVPIDACDEPPFTRTLPHRRGDGRGGGE